MAANTSQIQAELLQIELAIELDQGISVSEVAEKFGLTIAVVKDVPVLRAIQFRIIKLLVMLDINPKMILCFKSLD